MKFTDEMGEIGESCRQLTNFGMIDRSGQLAKHRHRGDLFNYFFFFSHLRKSSQLVIQAGQLMGGEKTQNTFMPAHL